MDGFITLIILVVVFNLLSAVMRSIKGGTAQNRSRQPAQKVPPAFDTDQIFPFAVKREFSDPEEQAYETEPEAESTFDDEHFAEYDEYDEEPEELQEEPVDGLPKPVEHAVRPQKAEASVTPGIRTVLTEKDSFLAAFILHEILDTPPSLRRLKRL